jgi:hypothetical protein
VTSSTDTTADHYRILGVDRDADSEEIRAAYRAKIRLWHPDLVGDEAEDVRQAATRMTVRLNEAYDCLSDTERRAAYDTRIRSRPDSTTRRPSASPPRNQRARRSGHRVRHITTISLGGIVAPLLGLIWASATLPAPAPPNPALIAALCIGVIAATTWLLTSSRLMRRPDRLARIGVLWSHLMRWSGWIFIGGCVVLLGIPAIVFTFTVVVAAPFFGLFLIALISGRFDSADR